MVTRCFGGYYRYNMVKYDASAFQPYAVLLRVFSAYLHEIFFASLAPFKLREQALAGAASLPSYECSSQNNPAIRRRVSPGMKVVDGDEEKRWTWDCLHFCEHSVRLKREGSLLTMLQDVKFCVLQVQRSFGPQTRWCCKSCFP